MEGGVGKMRKLSFLLVACLVILNFTIPVFAESQIIPHDGNILYPLSGQYSLKVNGIDIPVRAEKVSNSTLNIAMFSAVGNMEIEIDVKGVLGEFKLAPSAYGIVPNISGNTLKFTLDKPKYLTLEMKDKNPLILLITPPETEIPDKNDENVLYFEKGIHEPGVINLKSNQTLYIESGAVVIGRIQGVGVENVKVLGRGILESKKYTTTPYEGSEDATLLAGVMSKMNRTKAVFFQSSTNCKVDGIGVRNCREWQTLYLNDKNFEISNMNIMGTNVNNDGIDIDTVEDFKVHDNFIMAGDDGFGWHTMRANDTKEAPTRNIYAENNTIYNVTAGNGIRFGSSMETNLWENVTIKDTYILKSRGNAVMLDIQDWATVKNINIENVYVEDAPGEGVICVQIVKGKYSNDVEKNSVYQKDDYRGRIDGLTIKNLKAESGAGIIFKGYDETHAVENVTLENITISGEAITDISQVVMNKYVKNLKISGGINQNINDTFDSAMSRYWNIYRGNWYVQNGVLNQWGKGGASFILYNLRYSDTKISSDIKLSKNGQSVGLVIRAQDDKNYYLARLNTQKQKLELLKSVNNVLTLLGEADLKIAPDKIYSIYVDATGNTISCGVDNLEMISVTDSSFKEGNCGLKGYSTFRNSIDSFSADNFQIINKM